MRIEFNAPRNTRGTGAKKILAEAEVFFDSGGLFEGLKLNGFAVWSGDDRGPYVTVPSRAFGSGEERTYWYYVRSAEPATSPEGKRAVYKMKDKILAAYQDWKEKSGNRKEEPVEVNGNVAQPDDEVPF